MITVDGGIGPGTAAYIASGIEYANGEGAEALIIQLDTPGGLLESTRNIVTSLLESPIPIIVYVAPGGARAGSAGVFITLAANIAAMAPGTNIGAAHPVGIGGESDSSAMFDKVTNDAAAFVRSIAQKRNKDEEWAEDAVRQSVSATENEALELNVIDFIAPNVDSLLRAADGMFVETTTGDKILRTAGAEVEVHGMNWREELLSILSDPNIAYIFILLTIYGIMFELYNPGSIFPGVVGGISAFIAAYSLQMLPVNLAGLGLILLSVILFLIEIKVVSYGLLSIGGIISFLLGSIMLIDSPFEFVSISMEIIITATALTTLFFLLIITLGLRAQRKKKVSGTDGIAGEIGVAISNIGSGGKGRVKVHGEIWTAVSGDEISDGDEVEIISASGLTLSVKKCG